MSKHSARGSAWQRTRAYVLERDGYICAYCQREGDTADHIIPRSKGGTDDPTNLVTACRECNGRRQDQTLTRTTWINRQWIDAI